MAKYLVESRWERKGLLAHGLRGYSPFGGWGEHGCRSHSVYSSANVSRNPTIVDRQTDRQLGPIAQRFNNFLKQHYPMGTKMFKHVTFMRDISHSKHNTHLCVAIPPGGKSS